MLRKISLLPLKEKLPHLYTEDAKGCWVLHVVGDHGYGSVGIEGKTYKTHRLVYELFNGPIPEGLVVDHICCNKAYVNPKHLEAVTSQVNRERYVATFARTWCPYGHEYDEENTLWHKRKDRPKSLSKVCRACLNNRYNRRVGKPLV